MTLKRYSGNSRMSSAVQHGSTLYTKGVTPRKTDAEIEDQTSDVLEQIDDILQIAGTSRAYVFKVMIWLSSIDDFERMNSVYDAWLSKGNEPVRACVEARLANPAMKVEIQVEAAMP